MTQVSTIVEGHGEVGALPVLLRRIAEWQTPGHPAQILTPIRVRRDQFLNKEPEFRRHLLLAASKCGVNGWILVLLDADDDCPATLGPALLERARQVVPHRPVSVVLANREFEAWFIAAARSLDGFRRFTLAPGDMAIDPEGPRDAKGWIGLRIASGGYSETTDQTAFCSRIDLQQAHARSRSFRKLCAAWLTGMGRIVDGEST
jgi:hypothetical protein